jgi:hypothetical protein
MPCPKYSDGTHAQGVREDEELEAAGTMVRVPPSHVVRAPTASRERHPPEVGAVILNRPPPHAARITRAQTNAVRSTRSTPITRTLRHGEKADQARPDSGGSSNGLPKVSHAEPREASIAMVTLGYADGSFTSFRMTNYWCGYCEQARWGADEAIQRGRTNFRLSKPRANRSAPIAQFIAEPSRIPPHIEDRNHARQPVGHIVVNRERKSPRQQPVKSQCTEWMPA